MYKVKVLKKDLEKNWMLYLMVLPVIVYYLLFHYKPMLGVIIAFKDYKTHLGIWTSPWAGLKHFKDFFSGIYFWRLFKNTILLSFYSILFGFPAPIILALVFNEIRNRYFKKITQTISYLPHFISLVVVCGLIKQFSLSDGIFNDILSALSKEREPLLTNPNYFRTIYVSSGIWQQAGWSSIIYLAALSQIDLTLYEAAEIDGASRIRQLLHITLPSIYPTIIIMLILVLGRIMNVGFEKILLLYSPRVYEIADVISTYVYRQGIENMNFSFSSAVGLFNSVINFFFLLLANTLSRKATSSGLW